MRRENLRLLKFKDESLVWIYESNILWNSDYNLSACTEDFFEYKSAPLSFPETMIF